jgi:hypothetical protein
MTRFSLARNFRIDYGYPQSERWLSGLKRRIANPLYAYQAYRGFESPSLRHSLCFPQKRAKTVFSMLFR